MFWMIEKQHSFTFFELGTQCLNCLFFKRQKLNNQLLIAFFFIQYLLLLVKHFCIINRVLDNYDWEMVLLWRSVFQQTTATTDCISKSMVWRNDGGTDYELHVDEQNCHYWCTQYLRLSWYLIANERFVQAKIITKYVICIIWKRTYLWTKT